MQREEESGDIVGKLPGGGKPESQKNGSEACSECTGETPKGGRERLKTPREYTKNS